VPAAAVIRRVQALSGIIGFKGSVGGLSSQWLKASAQLVYAIETDGLELLWSMGNVWCSGEMHRYHTEHRKRRHRTKS
jgi:hypothetical protein